MPRDSSGNYTLPLGNPVVDGTVIDVNWANPTMSDIAVQLNNVLTRDGLLGPIAPFFIVDGTAALPGLAFISQNGSGLWRDATQVGLSVGGVAKQVWSSAGSQINGNFNVTGDFAAAGNVSFNGGIDGTPDLILKASGVERARIKANGLAGIGTNNPQARLHVLADAAEVARFVSSTTQAYLTWTQSTGALGYIGTGTISGGAATDFGIRSDTSLIFATGGANERMRVNAAGQVMIGTTTPGAKFTVQGGASLNDGDYNMNSTAGGRFIIGYNAFTATGGFNLWAAATVPITFGTATLERMRIDGAGNLLVGVSSGSYHRITKTVANEVGAEILSVERAQTGLPSLVCYAVSQNAWNAANAANKMGRDSNTLRSLNAAGTLNASGADYAEYEPNGGQTFAKGDVVGFDAAGVLTRDFSAAVRFGIKSTDPSYVGGDVWGTEEVLGMKRPDPEDAEATAEFLQLLEAARQSVDRVAYSGKVPVNVLGALPGGYIVADEGADGYIQAVFVDDIDFEQYKRAVGRVNRILEDGRAEVAVIVH